jgi:hypothetical protein
MLFIKGGSPYTKVVSENAKAPILLAISRFVNKGKIKTVLPMRLVWIIRKRQTKTGLTAPANFDG